MRMISERWGGQHLQCCGGMDRLDERVVLIATTNLYQYFDKALTRRFDSIIDLIVMHRKI